jgi:hypothetical protein
MLMVLNLKKFYSAGMETGGVPNLGRKADYRRECCLGVMQKPVEGGCCYRIISHDFSPFPKTLLLVRMIDPCS